MVGCTVARRGAKVCQGGVERVLKGVLKVRYGCAKCVKEVLMYT